MVQMGAQWHANSQRRNVRVSMCKGRKRVVSGIKLTYEFTWLSFGNSSRYRETPGVP